MTEHETPDMRIAREKHAAATDPHETPDQLRSRQKRGHDIRVKTSRKTKETDR